jgi:phage major head subunit gpT-like protein
MELSPGNVAALYTRYSKIFEEVFFKQSVAWPRIASLYPSEGETETHVWMDRIPQLRKWFGDRKENNVSLRSYTLPNIPFEGTIGLDKFKVEDNKIGSFDNAVRALAEQAKKWPDSMMFNASSADPSAISGLLASGASTSAVTYDGQPFFSTAHPQNPDNPNSATQSNYSSSGLALTHANFSTVRAVMRGYRGADGYPLKVNPNLLVVPPALEQTAISILESEWISPTVTFGGVAASAPSQNTLRGTADYLVVDDLAGQDTTWYLMDVKSAIKPFIFQLRTPAQFVALVKPTDPNMFNQHKLLYGVDARGNAGFSAYFLCYSATA